MKYLWKLREAVCRSQRREEQRARHSTQMKKCTNTRYSPRHPLGSILFFPGAIADSLGDSAASVS